MKKLFFALLCTIGAIISINAQEKTETFDGYTFTGPYTHKNLSVYLIQGKDTVTGQKFYTLQEGLKNKLVTVHETENVNQLQVSNFSKTHNIFIMAGDIVKGGKQDRAIQYNYIVPPQTKKMGISSFCVEQGRWQQRGNENKSAFGSSSDMVASKELKMSVKKEKSQSKVWENVAKMQDKLGNSLKNRVKGVQSESSLQLTLENKDLKKVEKEYGAYFNDMINGKDDVVGYAFVINGKINSAEIFAAKVLLQKLWPKLIKASIVEAISDYNSDLKIDAPSTGQIKEFMMDSEKAAYTSVNKVSKNVQVHEKENDAAILFETRDSKDGGKWINKSYMKK